jgi:hypothetical protein
MQLLSIEILDNTFDKGEIEAARQSIYYTHVDFDSLLL